MWTNYLKLGLKRIIYSLFLISCADIDYSSSSDWIYINQSQYEIAIVLGSGGFTTEGEDFTLKPQTQHTIKYKKTTGTSGNMQASDFITPYHLHGATLSINGKSYKIEEPEGIAGIHRKALQAFRTTKAVNWETTISNLPTRLQTNTSKNL